MAVGRGGWSEVTEVESIGDDRYIYIYMGFGHARGEVLIASRKIRGFDRGVE